MFPVNVIIQINTNNRKLSSLKKKEKTTWFSQTTNKQTKTGRKPPPTHANTFELKETAYVVCIPQTGTSGTFFYISESLMVTWMGSG